MKNKLLSLSLPVIALLFCGCQRKMGDPEEYARYLESEQQAQSGSGGAATPSEPGPAEPTEQIQPSEPSQSNPTESTEPSTPTENTTQTEQTGSTESSGSNEQTGTGEQSSGTDTEQVPTSEPTLVTSMPEIPEELANNQKVYFSMGEDGEAQHHDGTPRKETYEENDLRLINGGFLFPNSRDALGNGCLKVGSGTSDGFFDIDLTTLTDVYKVAIYLANYKTDKTAAKMSVDKQEAVDVGGQSNLGEYSLFLIDVNQTRLINFTFQKRVMINEIVFIYNN